MTAEQWLRTAVKNIDTIIFNGDLGVDNHKHQVYFGRCKGNKGTETIQPSDSESVTLEDFFPTTIGVDFRTSDVERLLANLTLECIKAFTGLTKGKAFAKKCKEVYFDKPYTSANPSAYLWDQIREVKEATENLCGEFPWKAVKFPVKEPKEKKPTKAVFFCPECGLEYTVPIKKLKGATGTPTCICGTKCGRDLSDEDSETQTDVENQD